MNSGAYLKTHTSMPCGGKKALAAKKKLDRRILALLDRCSKERHYKHCKKMFKRLRREKDHLFTFILKLKFSGMA